MAGGEPVSYVKGANLICVQTPSIKNSAALTGPLLSKVHKKRETSSNLIRTQAMFFDQLREKIPTVRHNPRFQEAFHSHV